MKRLLFFAFSCSVLLCACDAVSDTHDASSPATFASEALITQTQTHSYRTGNTAHAAADHLAGAHKTLYY